MVLVGQRAWIMGGSATFTDSAANNGNGAEILGPASMWFEGFTTATSGNYFIHYTAGASLWGG
jgi:hypothetical protein